MIWLRAALTLAVAALGSQALAKRQLIKWLTAGLLPWSCTEWKGLDAKALAERRREKERKWTVSRVLLSVPSEAYQAGDPRFFSARLIIDWEDNSAREGTRDGAHALGIKVSRPHLQALLSKRPGRNKKAGVVPDRNKKVGPQMRRVLHELKKIYPRGKVPDYISTEEMRARISASLENDSRNRGLAAPSWDTVNRALGRA